MPGTRRIGGQAVTVDDDQPTFWERVEAGAWEPGTLAVLEGHLGPGTTFLDLGAWVGPLSLYGAALGAQVVAVEADPAALAQLRRNLAANPDLAARIEVVAAAVSPRPGLVALGPRRKAGDSMSSALLAGREGSWTAEAVTPEALVGRLPVSGRLLVKLDIEGGEYALLPALGPLLARPDVALLASFHPAILVEAGEADPGARLREAVAGLEGWRARPVGRGGLAPTEIDPAAIDLSVSDTWLFTRPTGD